jgi:hypothetical protein
MRYASSAAPGEGAASTMATTARQVETARILVNPLGMDDLLDLELTGHCSAPMFITYQSQPRASMAHARAIRGLGAARDGATGRAPL